jgi:hypothetical protein
MNLIAELDNMLEELGAHPGPKPLFGSWQVVIANAIAFVEDHLPAEEPEPVKTSPDATPEVKPVAGSM